MKVIKKIHKDSAHYGNRKNIIGKHVTRLDTHTTKELKGWRVGGLSIGGVRYYIRGFKTGEEKTRKLRRK